MSLIKLSSLHSYKISIEILLDRFYIKTSSTMKEEILLKTGYNDNYRVWLWTGRMLLCLHNVGLLFTGTFVKLDKLMCFFSEHWWLVSSFMLYNVIFYIVLNIHYPNHKNEWFFAAVYKFLYMWFWIEQPIFFFAKFSEICY